MIEPMREYRIGPNYNYVEDDLIYTVLKGFTDVQTAKEYLALVAQVQKEQGQVYLIIDNSQNQSMDPGSRREFFELPA